MNEPRAEQCEQQPVRHTADTITDNDLDHLYDRIETLEHVAAGNRRHVQLIVPDLEAALARAEQAEAAVARARKLADDWAILRTHGSAAYELRAALDESTGP